MEIRNARSPLILRNEIIAVFRTLSHIPEDPQSVEPGKAAATTTLLFIMKSEPRRAREKWALTTHMTEVGHNKTHDRSGP